MSGKSASSGCSEVDGINASSGDIARVERSPGRPRSDAQPVARRFALRAVVAGAVAAAGATLLGTRRPDAAQASETFSGIWYAGGNPNLTTGSVATLEGDNSGDGGYGVWGSATGTSAVGVHGDASGGNSVGVSGSGTGPNGWGVFGIANNGSLATGVRGSSSSGNGVTGVGVYGVYGDGLVGVYGNGTSSVGVWGQSGSNAGVYGTSTETNGSGVEGACNAGASAYGVWGLSSTGYGVVGQGTGTAAAGVWGSNTAGDGVYGSSSSFTGVHGVSTRAGGTGVVGACNSGTSGYGVFGASTSGYGVVGAGAVVSVWGQGTSSATAAVEGDSGGAYPGVLGTTDGIAVFPGITAGVWGAGAHTGVLGTTSSSTAAGVEGDGVTVGVQGVSSTSGSATGYGVVGRANNGAGSAGILGTSTSGYGFYGFSSAAGGAGVLAYNTTTTGYGLQAFNGGAGTGYAAMFGSATPHSGNVLVRGTLTMLGGAPTVAARNAGGTLRRLYGVQSPESWFEDFGSAQLNGGSATVQLDPAFAELIDTSDYHVFLTAKDAWTGLYVTGQTATGFTVREAGADPSGDKPGAGGSPSGVAFSYRVVAKRKDVPAVRLESVAEPPDIVAPEIAQMAPAAPLPTAPAQPSAAAAALNAKVAQSASPDVEPKALTQMPAPPEPPADRPGG